MLEQLQSRVTRPVVEFIQHSDAVQAILQLFAAHHHHAEPHHATPLDIDWEDGEEHSATGVEAPAH